jgi:outer membrane protein OmpA-like peptidoglycan-associated protein
VAELHFDEAGEEICYMVTADDMPQPFGGHIHAAPAGATGPVVADFGSLDGRDIGCVPATGAAIDAILADLDGHYVELHDPAETFTIRAPLSEGTLADGSPVGDALSVDLSRAPAGAVEFDPAGDGAAAVIEAGRIILGGAVADRATADRLMAEFDGVEGLEVVDELTIVAGAPLPSGRITIDNSVLFGFDSDRLTDAALPVIADLAALLRARPDWSITVVGHTDATGDEAYNVELSRRRAEAVQAELIGNGVPEQRLTVEGAGSARPIDDNTTLDGRARNRRIEIEIDRNP